MTESALTVGVVLARRAVANPWINHVWVPHGVLPEAPDTPAWTILQTEGEQTLHYAGPATIELFISETTNYRDNLAASPARLWVACRSQPDGGVPESLRVTADPTEGEALFESGADIVGTVPMPMAIEAWLTRFVDTFHVERVFLKRQRDRSEQGGRNSGGGRGGSRERR